VGPFIGVLLAVVLYKLIRALEYEILHEEDDADHQALLLHKCSSQRKASSIIPLASVHPNPPSVRKASIKKETEIVALRASTPVKQTWSRNRITTNLPSQPAMRISTEAIQEGGYLFLAIVKLDAE